MVGSGPACHGRMTRYGNKTVWCGKLGHGRNGMDGKSRSGLAGHGRIEKL